MTNKIYALKAEVKQVAQDRGLWDQVVSVILQEYPWTNVDDLEADVFSNGNPYFGLNCNPNSKLDGFDEDAITNHYYALGAISVTADQFVDALLGLASPLTLDKVAFRLSEVGGKGLEVLLDIAAKHGVSHWENAEHYYSFGAKDTHVVWFEEDIALNGNDWSVPAGGRVIVSYATFLQLFKEHYGEVAVRQPKPRHRKRRRQKVTAAKTIVRVLYTTQQVYTFKNVRSVQIIEDKVFIQYARDITEGIKENSEVEIDGDLVMAVVIHEVGNRSNFFRNIDGTWDFQGEDGTVINSGKQLGRIF